MNTPQAEIIILIVVGGNLSMSSNGENKPIDVNEVILRDNVRQFWLALIYHRHPAYLIGFLIFGGTGSTLQREEHIDFGIPPLLLSMIKSIRVMHNHLE